MLSCNAELETQKKIIQHALNERNSVEILVGVFRRLYTLHHQLMQGGVTYHSSLNGFWPLCCRSLSVFYWKIQLL